MCRVCSIGTINCAASNESPPSCAKLSLTPTVPDPGDRTRLPPDFAPPVSWGYELGHREFNGTPSSIEQSKPLGHIVSLRFAARSLWKVIQETNLMGNFRWKIIAPRRTHEARFPSTGPARERQAWPRRPDPRLLCGTAKGTRS